MQVLIQIEESAAILKILGDKTRLTMIKMLEAHDYCVCEFVEFFQVSQPSISQHLRKLKNAGLVNEKKKGQWVFYSLNRHSDYYPFISNLLDALPNQNHNLEELKNMDLRVSCN